MTSLFVTSSGTDIGKTHVCCALLETLPATIRTRCIKPVVTGFEPATLEASDTARLLRAQARKITPAAIEATSPWRFRAALSADMAAAREGAAVPFGALVDFSREPGDCDLNLIEGIGGVMAPLDAEHTVLDWIASLETEVLLVVGSYLGTLSHTLTAFDVLARRNRRPLAIVVSQSADEPVPTAETSATLERFAGGVPVFITPRHAAPVMAPLVSLIETLIAPR